DGDVGRVDRQAERRFQRVQREGRDVDVAELDAVVMQRDGARVGVVCDRPRIARVVVGVEADAEGAGEIRLFTYGRSDRGRVRAVELRVQVREGQAIRAGRAVADRELEADVQRFVVAGINLIERDGVRLAVHRRGHAQETAVPAERIGWLQARA